jgi:plasmid stabilization system protein ParE
MANKSIVWDSLAFQHFLSAIEFIANDSITNADRIRIEILDKVESLALHPEMHPPDKYKANNNRMYRAFEIYRFRIAYYNGPDYIRIIRFRHTSREPKNY